MERNNYVPFIVLKKELELFEKYSVRIESPLTEEYRIYVLHPKYFEKYPNLMDEIGYQRKRSFSSKGAGGFEDLDIDEFDRKFYSQLILVKVEDEICEIIGGYRVFFHKESSTLGLLDMGRLYKMINLGNYCPAVELGRSWTKVEYQHETLIFSFLVLGLGVLRTMVFNEIREQNAKYWFGKVTNAANIQHLQLEFFDVHHPDPLDLMLPLEPFQYIKDSEFDMEGKDYKVAYRAVKNYLAEIWPIYLRMAPQDKIITCGTAINSQFGEGITETGLAIPIGKESETMIKMFVNPVEDIVKKNKSLMDLFL